jgi:hypothetical protein
MATSKQPAFPHPPLEVGVPQYPTPNVPDFYTKSGHIILVVKESVEKGPYNPKPLDGSVTYSGRDASKWPSTLYLVHQAPTPDGEYVYNTYANDRTLASQDAWNFGIDYSSEDPNFPIYTRTYIVPRSQYAPVAAGSTDPVFGGSAKIVAQKKQELPDDSKLHSRYVQVVRQYEPIPGPAITSKSLNALGATETTTNQVVAPGTGIDATGLVVADAVQPVSALKAQRKRVVMDALPANYNYYELTHDLAVITNTVSIIQRNVQGGTPPPPAIAGAIVDVTDTPLEFPYIRRVIKSMQTDGGGNPVLPPSRTEFSTGTYTFPGVIYDWNTILKNGQIESQLSFFNNRYPVSMVVPYQHDITYEVGEPNIADLRFYKVVTQPWAREFFKIPDNTIHPPAPVSLIGQTIYENGIDYGIQGGQSSTPTSYYIGQKLLIGGETTRWQGNIWIKRLTYVTEPPTTY